MWGARGLQVYGICNLRFVQREVVESRSNDKRSYLWRFRNPASGDSTGSKGEEGGGVI